jgi:hypothetical protein
MKLFQNIPPAAGHHSIQMGLKALALGARASSGGNGVPWRLSQLELDDEDRNWLAAWAKQLEAAPTAFWLQGDQPATAHESALSHAAGIGALLLLLATEYARRGLAQPDGWAVPAAQYFSAEARALLYCGDEPSPGHLRALRLAAHKLRLHSGRAESSQD